jgi:hypothetical protein
MAHQHVLFVKTNHHTTNHDSFVIAYGDYLRKIRTVEPTASEFGLCDCTARRLSNHVHAQFEKAQLERAVSYYEGESSRYFSDTTCSGVR